MRDDFKFVHCGHRQSKEMASVECFGYDTSKKVNAFHRSFPEYKPTPLVKLESLAKALGVESFHV